jgi:septal ring factor EnvC (AmiA/AmiB activator)
VHELGLCSAPSRCHAGLQGRPLRPPLTLAPVGSEPYDSRAMHAPEPRLPGVSVREAAIRVGTSESDIRRRIKRGELRAETFQRRGGTLFRVFLDDATDALGAAPATEMASESRPAPEALQDAPAATTRALDILDALLRASAETIDRQAETIAELSVRVGRADAASEAASTRARALQAEIECQAGTIRELERENGRLSAELAALRTAHAALMAPQSPVDAPWWRRWRAWLVAWPR